MSKTIFEKMADGQFGNTSSAVRAQRVEPADSLDDFPTPPWAARAVLRYVAQHLSDQRLGDLTAREPCANRGHMLRAMQEHFELVYASDVHDYGLGLDQLDYLFPEPLLEVDWTMFNPPFRLAEEFITRGLATSRKGVIVIARLSFLEGEDRERELYRGNRPARHLVFAERVPMLKGRLVEKGKIDPMAAKPGTKASTATAYSAFIWVKGYDGPTITDWLPKCRIEFECEGDYPDPPDGLAELRCKVPGSGRA